ncbi:hypothetical protein, partial [Mesorhizobium sp. M7A.F.Ca.CA.004.08.2.1]|uniref:hypothetical protein n=1 Tax=Mesorhizobium sp. M7A.F.Ca.CA.004.08.2.1 TaxID=2496731 RepID=UPI0019D42623
VTYTSRRSRAVKNRFIVRQIDIYPSNRNYYKTSRRLVEDELPSPMIRVPQFGRRHERGR